MSTYSEPNRFELSARRTVIADRRADNSRTTQGRLKDNSMTTRGHSAALDADRAVGDMHLDGDALAACRMRRIDRATHAETCVVVVERPVDLHVAGVHVRNDLDVL